MNILVLIVALTFSHADGLVAFGLVPDGPGMEAEVTEAAKEAELRVRTAVIASRSAEYQQLSADRTLSGRSARRARMAQLAEELEILQRNPRFFPVDQSIVAFDSPFPIRFVGIDAAGSPKCHWFNAETIVSPREVIGRFNGGRRICIRGYPTAGLTVGQKFYVTGLALGSMSTTVTLPDGNSKEIPVIEPYDALTEMIVTVTGDEHQRAAPEAPVAPPAGDQLPPRPLPPEMRWIAGAWFTLLGLYTFCTSIATPQGYKWNLRAGIMTAILGEFGARVFYVSLGILAIALGVCILSATVPMQH